MALPAGTVWEVRPGAGNDNNGGGFVAGGSGTDWSIHDNPQYALTGIASAGSGNTVLSAAAASDMVDNIAQVISGTNFNTGFFRVISVSVGVSITFGTNNASQSICSGVGASGVINIGGALATVSKAVSNLTNSNTVYIKGTYTVSAAQTLAGVISSSDAGPTTFNGYATGRDDGTRATWTTSTNSVDLVQFTQALGYLFKNIEFSSTAGTPGHGLTAKTTGNSGGVVLDNCLLHGFNKGIRGDFAVDWSFASLVLYRCRVYSCTSHGVHNDGSTLILGSYIHDNTGDGFFNDNQGSSAGTGAMLIWRSVIKSNGGFGVRNLKDADFASKIRFSPLIVIESDICNNTSDNIRVDFSTPGAFIMLNSIVDAGSAFGAKLVQAYFGIQLLGAVAWRSNSSGDVSNITKSPSDVTLTGDPYTNRAGDDFSLNSTAGAGAACKAIGQPTTFPP